MTSNFSSIAVPADESVELPSRVRARVSSASTRSESFSSRAQTEIPREGTKSSSCLSTCCCSVSKRVSEVFADSNNPQTCSGLIFGSPVRSSSNHRWASARFSRTAPRCSWTRLWSSISPSQLLCRYNSGPREIRTKKRIAVAKDWTRVSSRMVCRLWVSKRWEKSDCQRRTTFLDCIPIHSRIFRSRTSR